LYLTIDEVFMGQQSIALMGNYVANSTAIFVCPGDNYHQPVKQPSWSHRMRTCAMDGAMGDGSKWFGPKGGSPWPTFYNAKKLTDMHNPGPSDCWVITDEHPDSNDDATFYVDPACAYGTSDTIFTELPGSIHGKGAGMVFADGHAEVHVWKGKLDTPPVVYASSYVGGINVASDAAAEGDLAWFAQHTPAQ
jgi:prepilin-type processing-associated H-X9-DG protein